MILEDSTNPANKDVTERNVNKSKLFDSNIAGNFPAVKLATADDKEPKAHHKRGNFFRRYFRYH